MFFSAIVSDGVFRSFKAFCLNSWLIKVFKYIMSEPSSWRDLLKDIISDPAVREQLAYATGVHPVTLTRWSNGEVKPRVRAINQLLQVLPKEQSARLAKLLEKEQIV